MTAVESDAKLVEVLANQLFWKSPSASKVAVRILKAATAAGEGEFFADDIPHEDVPVEDRNVVGSLFKYLKSPKLGIIEPTGRFRKSEADGRRGCPIFGYRLAKPALAREALRRFGHRENGPQQELNLK